MRVSPAPGLARSLHIFMHTELREKSMLTQNDVLEYTGMHGHMIRVLWIDRAQALAWTYRLASSSALPEPTSLHDLEDLLRGGGARRLLVDPFAAAPPHCRERLALRPDRQILIRQRIQKV